MSEGAKKLVDDVIENLLDRRGVGNELEQIDADVMAELKETLAQIGDTAVAPLVTVLERITAESQRGTSGRLIVSHANEDELKKALEQWRTGR